MAKISTLTDDFNDGVINPRWQVTGNATFTYDETTSLNFYNSVAVYNSYYKQLSEVTPTSYDATNSFISVKVFGGLGEGTTIYLTLMAGINVVEISIGGGRIYALSTIPIGAITYDASIHKFIRIRELSGTIYFETSTDGITYTSFASMLSSSGIYGPINMTSVIPKLVITEDSITPDNIVRFKYLNNTNPPPETNPCTKLRGKCKLRGNIKIR